MRRRIFRSSSCLILLLGSPGGDYNSGIPSNLTIYTLSLYLNKDEPVVVNFTCPTISYIPLLRSNFSKTEDKPSSVLFFVYVEVTHQSDYHNQTCANEFHLDILSILAITCIASHSSLESTLSEGIYSGKIPSNSTI